MTKPDPSNTNADKPPIFKSWNQMYIFVFGHLIFLIILFYLFTTYFS